MDESIETESNKELAKAHVDYLGSYLERAHKLGHKGVHADVSRTEAIKSSVSYVFASRRHLGLLRKGEQ